MPQLAYSTLGESTSPPLIFLHGLGAGATQTTSSLSQLTSTYLIAPDMPGHGNSQDFDPQFLSFSYFADQVIALMDEMGIESSNIGGLSMGSGITLNLALRYPDRVKKIILLRPSWLDKKEPEHLKLVAYVGQWITEHGSELAEQKLRADQDFKKLEANNKPVADSITALFTRPETPASTAVLYKMWQDCPFDDLQSLGKITNKSIVITTSRDELHPLHTAIQIANHLPNCTQDDLPPRYHEPESYAQKLNNIINTFLTSS